MLLRNVSVFSRSVSVLAAVVVLAVAGLATGWAVSVSADDVLTNAVDPYDVADQKIKFLKAAGKENELDEKGFLADQKAGGNLVQPFEKWATVLTFDKNKNAKIDWFEFEAYRQAMRSAVMAGFDKNKDNKLTGDERDAALKALRDGKVEIKPPPETPRGALPPMFVPPAGGGMPAVGGGGGAQATSRPTSRPATQQAASPPAPGGRGGRGNWQPPADVVAKYDKDGDGKLDEAEMAAWRRDIMWDNMPAPMKDFTLRNFDADGDGKLSDEEWQAAEKYQRETQQMMQGWQSVIYDKDATEEQRRETMRQWAPTGMKIGLAMQKRVADAGGPEAFGQKMAVGMMRYTERFEKQALAEHDGKPSEASRAAMLKLIDADVRERVKKASVSGSGKLEPAEGEKLLWEVMDEFLKD